MDKDNARWWAMGATALTLFVIGLDMTVLNVALPDIAVDLHASTAQLQWFADAYLLVLAAVLLPAGMLGDRYGRKKLTLGALAVFGAGSLWCAYAGSAGSLIAARALLGLGAAVLLPLAMSAVVVLFEPSERPRAVLVLSLSTMIGLPLGPIIGGALLQTFWWGSVFVINVPAIVLAFVAVAKLFPADAPSVSHQRIDVLGAVAAGAGLLGLTYGVIEAPSRGWGDPVVLGAVLGGLVVLAGFFVWERRLRDVQPVFDYAVWADRRFRYGAICAAIASLALFGVMFTLPQYYRAVLGADALGTGVRTLPLVAGMILSMRGTTMLALRFSLRSLATSGFLLATAGFVWGATTSAQDTYLRSAGWTAVVGLGFGMALFSAQNSALLSLPRPRAATGSALVQTLRQVGSVLGIATLGALLNHVYRTSVDTHGLSAPAAAAVRESAQAGVAVAQQSGSGALGHSVATAFVSGMDASLWFSGAAALLGALVAVAFMPAREPGEAVGADVAESERAPHPVDSAAGATRTA
jgi:DHA2 family multidrug resistance protein-like MFS transporter